MISDIIVIVSFPGMKSLEPPLLDLSSLYKYSNSAEPILILAASGSDPFSEIRSLATSIKRDDYTEVRIIVFVSLSVMSGF